MFYHKSSLLPVQFDKMFLINSEIHIVSIQEIPLSIMSLLAEQISENFQCASKVQNFLILFLIIL